MKRNAWVGTSYVGATGAKVIEDWVYDSQYDAWFYIKADYGVPCDKWGQS